MTANLQSIDFHGEVVYLVVHPEIGKPFVPVKSLCAQLDIAWGPQHRKLTADSDLWGCTHMVIPSPDGPQTMTCLPLENLNGWLFSIQAARVKQEFRERLRTYQKECFQVLDAYWRTGAAIRPEVRAAAPEAVQGLFNEIEAMTGLDPLGAQPEGDDHYTWLSTTEAGFRLGVGRTAIQYRCAQYGIPTRKWHQEHQVPLELLKTHFSRHPIRTDVGRNAIPQGAYPAALPDGATLQILKDLYGADTARMVLFRLNPRVFPHPSSLVQGGAR